MQAQVLLVLLSSGLAPGGGAPRSQPRKKKIRMGIGSLDKLR